MKHVAKVKVTYTDGQECRCLADLILDDQVIYHGSSHDAPTPGVVEVDCQLLQDDIDLEAISYAINEGNEYFGSFERVDGADVQWECCSVERLRKALGRA